LLKINTRKVALHDENVLFYAEGLLCTTQHRQLGLSNSQRILAVLCSG